MIGHKHKEIWQLERDQGRKQGSATDMSARGREGGDIPNMQSQGEKFTYKAMI